MKVYAVLAIYQGVPDTIEAYIDYEPARRRALELASEVDLLSKPPDWGQADGEWDPQGGCSRTWPHHWWNDEHDVVVAECDVR